MRIGDLEFRDNQGNEIEPTKQQMAFVIDKLLKEIYKFEKELAEFKEKYEDCENERLQNRIEYLTMKNKWLSAEKELAEFKEKAIVPKFKVGQNIFFIDNECQIAQGVVDVILTGQDVFENWCKYSIDLGLEYEDDIRFIDKNEEEIFATKEETQDKLKEMKGNE